MMPKTGYLLLLILCTSILESKRLEKVFGDGRTRHWNSHGTVVNFTSADYVASNPNRQSERLKNLSQDVIKSDLAGPANTNIRSTEEPNPTISRDPAIPCGRKISTSGYNPIVYILGPKGDIKSIIGASDFPRESFMPSYVYNPTVTYVKSYGSNNGYPSGIRSFGSQSETSSLGALISLTAIDENTNDQSNPIISDGLYGSSDGSDNLAIGSFRHHNNHDLDYPPAKLHDRTSSVNPDRFLGHDEQEVPLSRLSGVTKSATIPVYENVGETQSLKNEPSQPNFH